MKIKIIGCIFFIKVFAVSVRAGDYELKNIFPFKFSNPIFMNSVPGYPSGLAFAVIEKKGKLIIAVKNDNSKKGSELWKKTPLLDMQKRFPECRCMLLAALCL